jgi:hypothetical protein
VDKSLKLSRQEFDGLCRRVDALESLLTPAQRAELDLLQKAEHVVNVARQENMLLPEARTNRMPKRFREHWEGRED